jgi:hypothetical protein
MFGENFSPCKMERGALDQQEAFIDGSFASAKKGALCWSYQPGQRNEVDGGSRLPE